jgi:hypothetical protein
LKIVVDDYGVTPYVGYMKKNELKVTRIEKMKCFGGGFNTVEVSEVKEWKGSLGPVLGETAIIQLGHNPCILDADETHLKIEAWNNEEVWIPRNEISHLEYNFCNQCNLWLLAGVVISENLAKRMGISL